MFQSYDQPNSMVLADKTALSKGKASNMAPPMGAGMDGPTGVKAAKTPRRKTQAKCTSK